jgi:hypothetical protein
MGQASVGPINAALRFLGVTTGIGCDEFDVVGLGTYREFDNLFEKYWGND